MEKTSLSRFSHPAGGHFPSHLLATPTSLTYSAHLCTQLTCIIWYHMFTCSTLLFFAMWDLPLPSQPVPASPASSESWSWSQLSVPDQDFDLRPAHSCLPIKTDPLVSVPAARSLSALCERHSDTNLWPALTKKSAWTLTWLSSVNY